MHMGQIILVILIIVAVVIVMAFKIYKIVKEKDTSGCPFCDGNCTSNREEQECTCGKNDTTNQ